MSVLDSFVTPIASAKVRAIYLPVGQLGEKLVIAVVGYFRQDQYFANRPSDKLLSCLPSDLAHALHGFGNIVVAEYLEHCARSVHPDAWTCSLRGLELGEWFDVDGVDEADAQRVATTLCAFAGGIDRTHKTHHLELPRSRDEHRFMELVRDSVVKSRPSLANAFAKPFSISGRNIGGEIDFVGSHYVTCYSAINPRSQSASRVQAAAAALWRLARARDAFGFATPSHVELTAWTPPPGQPIFSRENYASVEDTIAELKAQAEREDIRVFEVNTADEARARLLAVETSSVAN